MHNKEWLTTVKPSINGNTWDVQINGIPVGFIIEDNAGYYQPYLGGDRPYNRECHSLNSAAGKLISWWFTQAI